MTCSARSWTISWEEVGGWVQGTKCAIFSKLVHDSQDYHMAAEVREFDNKIHGGNSPGTEPGLHGQEKFKGLLHSVLVLVHKTQESM